MFTISYPKSFLALLLGMEKPSSVRVKAEWDDKRGYLLYTPQAKWVFGWCDNKYTTRKVKELMWSLYGPRASGGIDPQNIEITGGISVKTKAFIRAAMVNEAYKLDFFPFDPPAK